MYSPNHYRITVEEDDRYYQWQEMQHFNWEEESPNYYSPVAQFKKRLEEDRKNDR